VVGGSSDGVGGVIARKFADRGDDVIVTSRDVARAEAAAKEIGGHTRGLAIDLSRPATIKLVGYAEAVRVLRGRFRPGASVVLFGGLAKERPCRNTGRNAHDLHVDGGFLIR
jgi:NAD(P)-dependent dehydrogenase (short-subunit alcohol dehydrogenase family)